MKKTTIVILILVGFVMLLAAVTVVVQRNTLQLQNSNRATANHAVPATPVEPMAFTPQSIQSVPTPQSGGGVDIHSYTLEQSKQEVEKLRSSLPYQADIQTTAGIPVTVAIPPLSAQSDLGTLEIQIYQVDYAALPGSLEYATMRTAFREAANTAFSWIRSHGANPSNIVYVWGTKAFIQHRAEEWLR